MATRSRSALTVSQMPSYREPSRALLVDPDPHHAQKVLHQLEKIGIAVDTCGDLRAAAARLRMSSTPYELVLVEISDRTKSWERIIHNLQEAAHQSHHQPTPFFLCISRSRTSPELRLALERKGARLAYEE